MSIVYDESSVYLACHTSDWVFNSGASFHVTAHRDYFTFYTNGDYGHVRRGNKGTFKIVGTWDICFEIIVGCKLSFKKVRCVPDIHLNMISASKLGDDGYTNQFSEEK